VWGCNSKVRAVVVPIDCAVVVRSCGRLLVRPSEGFTETTGSWELPHWFLISSIQQNSIYYISLNMRSDASGLVPPEIIG